MKGILRESPERVELVTFRPGDHGVELLLRDGRTLRSHYVTDQSAAALEEVLDDEGVRHDVAGTSDSAWFSFLTYLLPFILFFVFWIFLIRRMQRPGSRGDAA